MDDIAVLGAGWSGLAAARALDRRGLRVQGYEQGSGVGGLWRLGNDNGRSVAYDALRMNTSRDLTSFEEFPFPPGCPPYPGHRDVAAYLDAYANRFDLRRLYRFRSPVASVAPAPGGGWDVDGRRFRAVLVATGHHAEPRWPELRGAFDGLRLHAREYREPSIFEGRRVLVMGLGNSAVDIAGEAAGRASAVFLSTRRGAHVLPKFLFGEPLDVWGRRLAWLPPRVQGAIVGALLRVLRGRLSDVGLPEPAHRLHQAHPTVSDDLLPHLRAGRIRAKPDVAELLGRRVRFADGSEEEIDVLLCATGYRPSFPFLGGLVGDPEALPRALYLGVVPLDLPAGIFFIGLVQPQQGPISRAAEAQAAWAAALLAGEARLPEPAEMRAAVDAQNAWRDGTMVAAPRHAMEVDYYRYLKALRRAQGES